MRILVFGSINIAETKLFVLHCKINNKESSALVIGCANNFYCWPHESHHTFPLCTPNTFNNYYCLIAIGFLQKNYILFAIVKTPKEIPTFDRLVYTSNVKRNAVLLQHLQCRKQICFIQKVRKTKIL